MKHAFLIGLTFVFLMPGISTAQYFLGINRSWTNNTRLSCSPDKGKGVSLNYLSKYFTIPKKVMATPVHFQYGISVGHACLGRKYFYNVPMNWGVGASRVRLANDFYTLDLVFRFSLPNYKFATPYEDLYLGYCGIYSSSLTNPNITSWRGFSQSPVHSSIAAVSGITYGFGGGFIFSLGKHVKLDLGLSYFKTSTTDVVADLSSAYSDARGVNFETKKAPPGLLQVRLGLLFYFNGSGSTSWAKGPKRYSAPIRTINEGGRAIY